MRVHKSKVDRWLIGVTLAAIIASLCGAVVTMLEGTLQAWMVALILVGLGGIFPAWILLSTRYIVAGEALRIACGPFRWTIPVAQISSVTPCRDVVSSPALSLDRLRIEYGAGGFVLISPRDKAAFLRDLEAAQHQARQA
jgi:hypothetical protein